MTFTHFVRSRSIVAVALLLLWPSIAMSAGPEKTAFSATETAAYLFAPNPDGSFYVVTCSGDPVMHDVVTYGTLTTWRDTNGDVLKIKMHAMNVDEFYLESGEGRRLLSGATSNTFTLTPGASGVYEGVTKWTGLFWHVVVPGVGVVLLDAGFEIIDFNRENPLVVRRAGKHQWLDGDFDAFCAALRP